MARSGATWSARQTYDKPTLDETRPRQVSLMALAGELWPWVLVLVLLAWAVLGFISQ